MKKAIALLATLVVLTSTTFAQLAPTISGDAETKWGVNLDDGQSGFETSTSVTVTVPVVASETKMTDGEGATGYASITGTSLEFKFDLDSFNDDDELTDPIKGSDASISAKINFAGGMYATIGAASDIKVNKSSSNDDTYDIAPDFGGENGISLGYAKDAIAFELTIKNEDNGFEKDDEDDAAVTTAQVDATDLEKEIEEEKGDPTISTDTNSKTDLYYLGATGSYTTDLFSLGLAFGTTAAAGDLDDADKKTGFGFELKVMPTEAITITVPGDVLSKEAGVAMEFRPALAATFGALGLGVDVHYISIAADLISAAEDYANATLAGNISYALDAGTAKVEAKSNLGDMDSETMSAELKLMWTAAVYNATLDLGDVTDLGAVGLDGGFTGVEGLTVAVETTLNDGDVSFALDKLQLDFASALTGVENTVFTVNYSDFDTDGTKGTFYVGAKISL